MREKNILFIITLLIVMSMGYLFWKNMVTLDPAQSQNWWSVAFTTPHDREDLSFIIENRSTFSSFSYTVKENTETLKEGMVTVPSGTAQTVSVQEKSGNHPVISVWTSDGKKKEIYR